MKLFIDTTKPFEITVALMVNDKKIIKKIKTPTNRSSNYLLKAVLDIIKENNLKLNDITEVEVERGPGSFTGIRVGVSIANALGYALGIPVNGRQIETDLHYT